MLSQSTMDFSLNNINQRYIIKILSNLIQFSIDKFTFVLLSKITFKYYENIKYLSCSILYMKEIHICKQQLIHYSMKNSFNLYINTFDRSIGLVKVIGDVASQFLCYPLNGNKRSSAIVNKA